jgi:pimeloyl-ACP methyl ester carboxylesterase
VPYIQSDGVRLYAEETGSGLPIIWLHEFAADLRTWEGQVRRFSRDYRCITYNARGYPPSDVPESDEAYTHQWHTKDLQAILDGFAIDRAHIVGLSMGAYTGLQFAVECPHRVISLLFASGGSGAPRSERDRFLRDCNEGAARMQREGMTTASVGLATGPSRIQLRHKDPRGWEEFQRYLGEHSATGSALTLRNFQALRPSIYDFEASLRNLDVPVLLAVGDEDDPVIETNLFLKRVLPRAGLWVCPKTGHGINLEEPDSFNGMASRFLSAVERGRWGRRDPRARPGPSAFGADRTNP